MRKIYLFCAAGMSTSLLVTKMKDYAKSINYDCDISAHSVREISTLGKQADVVLLGPQVRYELKGAIKNLGDKPIEVIDTRAYGMIDGKAVVEQAKRMIGD